MFRVRGVAAAENVCVAFAAVLCAERGSVDLRAGFDVTRGLCGLGWEWQES